MNLFSKIFLVYAAILAVFLTVSVASPLQFLLLPLPIYFGWVIFSQIRNSRKKGQSQIKPLIYYNFVVVTIMTISGFLGAQSLPQLLSAVLFFPLAVYFLLEVLPRKKRALTIPDREPPVIADRVLPDDTHLIPKAVKAQSFDINRRGFVKFIGSAGLALFFLTMFTRKTPGDIFSSAPGSQSAQIDPAVAHPTDGYTIARIDDSTPSYYGFLNKDGAWFIMREEGDGTYQYARGSSDFVNLGWGVRDTLTYGEFNAAFD